MVYYIPVQLAIQEGSSSNALSAALKSEIAAILARVSGRHFSKLPCTCSCQHECSAPRLSGRLVMLLFDSPRVRSCPRVPRFSGRFEIAL